MAAFCYPLDRLFCGFFTASTINFRNAISLEYLDFSVKWHCKLKTVKKEAG